MRQVWTSQGKIRAKEKENSQNFSKKVLDKLVSLGYNESIKNGIGN